MNDPFDFFDRIYCINLDRRTDRWAQVSAELQRVGLAQRVERVAAFDDADGAIGCRDSHVECVRRALQCGAEVMLILEDDVRFVDEPRAALRRALDELASVGHWDALYLGAETMEPPLERLRHVFRGRVLQTHAVALHRRAFGRALHSVAPVDVCYALTLRSWVVDPPIALQHTNRSDISPGLSNRAEAIRRSRWLHLEASMLERWVGSGMFTARRRLGRAIVAGAARLGLALRFEGLRPRLDLDAQRGRRPR